MDSLAHSIREGGRFRFLCVVILSRPRASLAESRRLNESGYVDDSIASFKGRTIHTYHTDGVPGLGPTGSRRVRIGSRFVRRSRTRPCSRVWLPESQSASRSAD